MTARGWRRGWFIGLAVGVYAAIGFLVLPAWVRPHLERRLGAELQRRVGVGAVRINPFTGTLALERVEVLAPNGTDPFMGCRRLELNLDPLQAWRREWVLGAVVLEDFYGAVEIAADGRLNCDDLLAKFAAWRERATDERRQAWPWRLRRLVVAGARIDVTDRSRPEVFRTLIGPVDVTLAELRTAGGRGAPHQLEAKTESGERLRWSGTLTAKPFAAVGEWRVENLLLAKYAPYFDERLTALLTSGKLTMQGRYDVSLAPDDRHFVLSDGVAQLEKVKLLDPATGASLLEFATAEVTGFGADLLARRVGLERLQVTAGRLAVQRDPERVVNLFALVKPRPGAARDEPKPFDFTAGELALRDFTIEVGDRAAARPVAFALTRVDLTLKEFTTARGAVIPFELTFGMPPQGTARITGDLGLRPWRANADLELAWIGLAPFSPYFERRLSARLARGTASVQGRLTMSGGGDTPELTFTGAGRVEEGALVAQADGEEFAGFSSLTFEELALASVPRPSLQAGSVKVSGPFLHLTVDEAGRSNAGQLMPPAMPPPAARPVRADFALGRVTVDGGEVTFVDRSLQPMVQLAARQIGGTLQNLSTRTPARGELELRGLVEGESPVIVKGRFNPFGPHAVLDAQLELRAAELRAVAPYVARFSGHEFVSGRASAEASVKLVEQKLDVRSTWTLEQFALGDPVAGVAALPLPVKLAVALLKDAEGRIVLEVPVGGSLTDPQFRVARAVGEVLTATLAKVATSPFAVLGEGWGAGEELAQQEFAPGDENPTPRSRERLDLLRQMLAARPALSLDLTPGYDAGEVTELKRRRLDADTRQRVWSRLRQTNATAPPLEQLLISNDQRAEAVTELFHEQFPRARSRRQNAVSASPPPVPASPPIAVARPAEPERRGLFRRAFDVATLKGVRERIWGEDEPPPTPTAAPVTPPVPAPAVSTAAAPRGQSDLPPEEMERRLLGAMPVGPRELRELAEARARRVKQLLIEGGALAPERVRIVEVESAEAATRGARVILQLR